MSSVLLFLPVLALAPILNQPVWASAPPPQQWGMGCFDDDCVWIKDANLFSGEEFTVSTLAPGGAVLGAYSATSMGNTITFRPNSLSELKLLSGNAGLRTSVSPTGISTPILEFVAIKGVTSTSSSLTEAGHPELLIHLNGNPSFRSASYSVNFLDAPTRKKIGVAANVSTSNPVLLSIDLSSLPAVAAAYNSEGVFLQITNVGGTQLNGEYYAQSADFGMLDNFYRATQLQDTWTLLDRNLLNVQSALFYLFAPAVDVPYLPKFGANSTEVPFADSFVITHFLGGNTKGAVSPICADAAYKSYCEPIEPWSLDYLVSDNNKLTYQSELVYNRLNPYLNAGYQPSDITIGLDNVPWAIASNAPPQNWSRCVQRLDHLGTLGLYGECNPPAAFSTWRNLVSHLTGDLTAEYGAKAAQFNYEVGDEFDVTSTYNGRPGDFYYLYQYAFQAVHATFPNASVVPGDFSGEGSCRYPYFTGPVIPGCTYDTQAFLHHEIALGMVPKYIPRSANNFWDINQGPTPSGTAGDVINSYAYVETDNEKVIPEIHQFGFLDMPFGPVGDDTSSLSANWDFQMLLQLKQGLPTIRRVFTWGGVESVGDLNFLNGNGWIRMLFDNLQGSELYMLPLSSNGTLTPRNEVMAVGMVTGNDFRIFISNFDLPSRNKDLTKMQFDPPVELQVTLPAVWVTEHPSWSYLRYSESPVDNVYAQIKADFGPNILTSQFAQCSVCFTSPLTMVSSADTDTGTAREILAANWTSGSNYVGIMQNGLKWRGVTSFDTSGQLNIDSNGVTHDFSQSGNVITVTLGANEMLVLKP